MHHVQAFDGINFWNCKPYSQRKSDDCIGDKRMASTLTVDNIQGATTTGANLKFIWFYGSKFLMQTVTRYKQQQV